MSTRELYEALDQDPDEAPALVQQLRDEGVDLNDGITNIRGRIFNTPLTMAAQKQSPEIVELLLDKGAMIDVPNTFGLTALMFAVSHSRVENCKVLLERGADMSLRDYNCESAFSLAVANDRLAVVKLLLESGVDINVKDGTGGSLLPRAVKIDYADVISIGGEEIKRIVESFSTTKLEIMRLLIDNGLEIDVRDSDETTALHTFVVVGDIEAVKILLDASADPNLVDDCNRKPLWPAVRGNHIEIVKLLLGRTTDIDDQVYNGHTCLSTGARWRYRECVKLLLGAGADIWSQEPGPQFLEPERRLPWYGCDALYWAVRGDGDDHGDHEIVRMILAAGAERENKNGADAEYSKWLNVWNRAQPEEMEGFRKWVASRCALMAAPELEAVRDELSKKIDRMREEKRRNAVDEMGLRRVELIPTRTQLRDYQPFFNIYRPVRSMTETIHPSYSHVCYQTSIFSQHAKGGRGRRGLYSVRAPRKFDIPIP